MEKYILKNLDCAACASKIETNLKKMEGVKFATINFANSTLTIDTNNIEKVKSRIKKLEPEVEIIEYNSQTKVSPKITNENNLSIFIEELEENKVTIIKASSCLILLLVGILFREKLHASPYSIAEYAVFIISYLIVGGKVIISAVKNTIHGQFFDEQFLMTIATVGALAINQLPEAVAVMLFYVIGEFFQDVAVGRSRKSIKALLEIKPEYANLQFDNKVIKVSPEDVKIGEIIIVKPGEKVPLDGIITHGSTFVDTAALTGESTPRKAEKNDEILAGVINQSGTITVKVNKLFSESSVSKILELVENATSHKAETEKFITTFSKY
jgi:Cd2+/Zn2+-exporting ATPase